jgi:hypothetical protein
MTLGSNGLVDHMPFFFSLTILEWKGHEQHEELCLNCKKKFWNS